MHQQGAATLAGYSLRPDVVGTYKSIIDESRHGRATCGPEFYEAQLGEVWVKRLLGFADFSENFAHGKLKNPNIAQTNQI